ncbi:MAG TPA: prepilin peptidase [Ornithinicoccus sp.]|nr:prepilin peptidase [Ornithinicoccus sp.]
MSGAVVVWVLTALGAVAGVPVVRWLQGLSYRRPDEVGQRAPGSRWWVVAALAAASGVTAWRLLLAGTAGHDPGAGTGREGWVQAVVLLTLLLVVASCVAMAAIDLDVHRLPDRLMFPTMGVLTGGYAVAAVVAAEPGAWLRALLAGLACGAGYLLLALLSMVRGSLGIGLGDVKLAALLGAALGWFGWAPVLVGMYAGFLAGGLAALVLLVTGRVRLRDGDLAYGPPMMVGALLGLLAGPGALGLL